MTVYELKAAKRTVFGKKLRALRRTGVTPGNIFGKNTDSVAIQVDGKILLDTMRKAGETSLIHVKVEGEAQARPVLVASYAQDAVSGQLLHVDLHQVDLKQKTTATVPVKTVGEAPAVAAGNIFVLLKNEIDVEALPTDLPEAIEVDITGLTEVGMSIAAKDLKVDRAKVELQIGEDELIATIQEPAPEEVVETPEASEAPAEAPAKAEGEAAAAPAEPKAE
jgi:large subunit ribosomal protein L25